MSKQIVSSVCAAAVLSFAVATAQTATGADTQQVAISGCVARATTANQAGQYVLNNATRSNMPIGQIGAAGTVDVNSNVPQSVLTESDQTPATERSTAGAVGTSGHASSYMLVPGRTNLSMWVGQRVEVTGVVVSNAASTRATGTAGTTGSTQSANNAPRLRVISVRAIPGNCL